MEAVQDDISHIGGSGCTLQTPQAGLWWPICELEGLLRRICCKSAGFERLLLPDPSPDGERSKKCPRGGFPYETQIGFADGTTNTVKGTIPCPHG
jgi:hypothetical protein